MLKTAQSFSVREKYGRLVGLIAEIEAEEAVELIQFISNKQAGSNLLRARASRADLHM